MQLYVPLMKKVLDSSVWEEDPVVRVVFITMLIKKDSDDIVRGTAYNVSRWANLSELETIEAIKVLESPDTKRLESQEYDGRRVERVRDEDGRHVGWRMLNGPAYRALIAKERTREAKRLWAERNRATGGAAKPRKPLPGELEHGRMAEAGARVEQLDAHLAEHLGRVEGGNGE